MAKPASVESVSAPMREFLQWVAFRPRTHADAIEAWASHCPRFTQWEDALDEGFIALQATKVCLTAKGNAALFGDADSSADGGDPARQLLEPGLDLVTERRYPNQDDHGDGRDEQAVLDEVLRGGSTPALY